MPLSRISTRARPALEAVPLAGDSVQPPPVPLLFPLSSAAEVDTAVQAAQKALASWRNVPVNNAWTFTPAPYQGQWYEAATIIDSGFHATNSGSWINYSSYPVTGPGTAYSITQPSPGSFQFVNTPDARHYNVYSTAILGAPLCNVPNPAAPWPPAGC